MSETDDHRLRARSPPKNRCLCADEPDVFESTVRLSPARPEDPGRRVDHRPGWNGRDWSKVDLAAHDRKAAAESGDGRLRECSRMTPEGRSDRSDFGEPLDCELVGAGRVPADSGLPCSPCLRGKVVRVLVETGGVVW